MATVPRYNYEQIRAKADEALKKHHPSGVLPIPLQAIVEFSYEITIVPIPGLYDTYDIDAFTGKSRKTIHIDEGVFQHRSPNRYRFSLAHELGHIELHQEFFDEFQFNNIEEWKSAHARMLEWQRNTLEFQAYEFAGLFLVPREPLIGELDRALKVLQRAQEVRKTNFDLRQNSDLAKPYVCNFVAKRFQVSEAVIEKRLTKDGLWPPH